MNSLPIGSLFLIFFYAVCTDIGAGTDKGRSKTPYQTHPSTGPKYNEANAPGGGTTRASGPSRATSTQSTKSRASNTSQKSVHKNRSMTPHRPSGTPYSAEDKFKLHFPVVLSGGTTSEFDFFPTLPRPSVDHRRSASNVSKKRSSSSKSQRSGSGHSHTRDPSNYTFSPSFSTGGSFPPVDRPHTPHQSPISPAAFDDDGAHAKEKELLEYWNYWKGQVTNEHAALRELRIQLENCYNPNQRKYLEAKIVSAKETISKVTQACAEAKADYERFMTSPKASGFPRSSGFSSMDSALADEVAHKKSIWDANKAYLTKLHSDLKTLKESLIRLIEEAERIHVEKQIASIRVDIQNYVKKCSDSKNDYEKAKAAQGAQPGPTMPFSAQSAPSSATSFQQQQLIASLKAKWDQAKAGVTKAHAKLKSLRQSEAAAPNAYERDRLLREIEVARSEISNWTLACTDAKLEYEKATGTSIPAEFEPASGGSFHKPTPPDFDSQAAGKPPYPNFPFFNPPYLPEPWSSKYEEVNSKIEMLEKELEQWKKEREYILNAARAAVKERDSGVNDFESHAGTADTYASEYDSQSAPRQASASAASLREKELQSLEFLWELRSNELTAEHERLNALKGDLQRGIGASSMHEIEEVRVKISELTRECAELSGKMKRLQSQTAEAPGRDTPQSRGPYLTPEQEQERQKLMDAWQEAKKRVRSYHNLLHNHRKTHEMAQDPDYRQHMSNQIEETKREISIATNQCAIAKKNYEDFSARFGL